MTHGEPIVAEASAQRPGRDSWFECLGACTRRDAGVDSSGRGGLAMTSPEDREALQAAIMASPGYRLAYEDATLLAEADLRPLRLQMELLKPERALREQGIHSTVVVFGSTRIVSPQVAQTQMARAEALLRDAP
jgi:hypothetical protein